MITFVINMLNENVFEISTIIAPFLKSNHGYKKGNRFVGFYDLYILLPSRLNHKELMFLIICEHWSNIIIQKTFLAFFQKRQNYGTIDHECGYLNLQDHVPFALSRSYISINVYLEHFPFDS